MRELKQHPVITIRDKNRVPFTYNGKQYCGNEDEAVSSALIANNIHIFSYHHKNHAPQGLFCSNGQCSHCTVLINGFPQKSCITPLKTGMDIRTLKGLPKLPDSCVPLGKTRDHTEKCDVLVLGAGPSGLTASLELAEAGFSVILADDKAVPGGKLLLQTHKFFGSTEDCYAGMRGVDIAVLLESKVQDHPAIRIMSNAMVAGIYKDHRAGVFVDNQTYKIIDFKGLLVSSGARERSLIFPGNHLPGIYGAGAFQTLVNRDGIKAADHLFIVGSGNVGLIAAYHALQAGIGVRGICDILPDAGGYKVHADKIRRMGVPLYFRHTVLHANGEEKLERVTIAEVDKDMHPLLNTAKTFDVDTLLVAVGLAPVDEFYDMAAAYGFPVVKAGDADEIAEASSAMFGGRIAGRQMAEKLGKNIGIDASFYEKAKILKSPPGKTYPKQQIELKKDFQPVIHCVQEIPCNPCETVCPVHAIRLNKRRNNILDLPEYTGNCTGCMKCVAVCPGLAISLARRISDEKAEVVLPCEFIPDFTTGEKLALTDREGNFLEKGIVKKIRYYKPGKTRLLTLEVTAKNARDIAGFRVQPQKETQPSAKTDFSPVPDDAMLCRCEMVTVKEVRDFIREHHVRDLNQLKVLRVGMGSCGGKNCSLLLPRIFKELCIPPEKITENTRRPLSVEIPMHILVNEKEKDSE